MLSPLVSEAFTNDAVTGTVSYPTSGAAGTSNASEATLNVSYDAGSNSYTVSVTGRSQTFRPADIDASAGSAASTVYVRTNGSTTDSLTLLKPSGTPGPLAYRYVGAGYWQRTVETSSTISGSFDAFTYGVKTPDAAVPRTGAASYRVELLGIVGLPNEVRSISGAGTLLADFSIGQIRMQGTATEYDSVTGIAINPYMAFFSQVGMTSGRNNFAGAFRYYSDTSRPDPYDGAINGRFYGPGAEEIGGAFAVRRSDGASAVGTITGARGGSGTNLSLITLAFDQNFLTASNSLRYLHMANGNATDAVGYDGNISFGNQLTYAAATGSWNFSPDGSSPGDLTLFTPGDLNASLSNSRFTVYERASDGNIYRLALYKPGASNDQLALSYAGFGYWERTTPIAGTGGAERTNFEPFIYAIRTPALAIPTTGTASYNGVLYGRAAGSGFDRYYSISGTSRFDLNFGTQSFVVTLRPVGIEGVSGTSVDFGDVRFTGNSLGDMLGKDSGGDTRFRGYLAGPNADEVAGEFFFGLKDPLNPALGDVYVNGVTVAKRCSPGC